MFKLHCNCLQGPSCFRVKGQLKILKCQKTQPPMSWRTIQQCWKICWRKLQKEKLKKRDPEERDFDSKRKGDLTFSGQTFVNVTPLFAVVISGNIKMVQSWWEFIMNFAVLQKKLQKKKVVRSEGIPWRFHKLKTNFFLWLKSWNLTARLACSMATKKNSSSWACLLGRCNRITK